MTETLTARDLLTSIQDRRATYLRFGAVCALVGTLGYVVAFVLHGDLPDQSTESLLTFIADRPWALHHLLIAFCFLLWIGALSGLSHSFTGGKAWVLGRLGQTTSVLGMAVLLWHYNLDGPALEHVADAWVEAEGVEKAVLLERGTILTEATSGMFPLYVALLLGLPFVLFGLAVVCSDDYPSWLGWVGAAAGGLAFAVGSSNFAGFEVLPRNLFVLSVLLLDFWMIAVGLLMWRRGARLRSAPVA
ncbi:hypothetical protein [Saccharopolyspora mangrovi]|uniref:DUF4386 family protein n=1 Tax=Saccharopolyspora mangrovi TaxID=3082379 RepID=A0ABU6AEX1_9PSEU|nr:hypothetical protein [Saccharopolyspora sp. S2-29]MEB3370090.1 hypothetical protein [Saccharopolyspora sp. S2-29]